MISLSNVPFLTGSLKSSLSYLSKKDVYFFCFKNFRAFISISKFIDGIAIFYPLLLIEFIENILDLVREASWFVLFFGVFAT